jgi:hypothetical protein
MGGFLVPAALPTDPAVTKSVKDWGMGAYDSQRDDEPHGEDCEEREPAGKTLPDDGGPLDPFGPERYISYPQSETSQGKHASGLLPGDENRPPSCHRSEEDVIDQVIPSVAYAELPSDEDNPAARADYYDKMTIGESVEDIWPDEDTGAYASEDEESLPAPTRNEMTMKDWLGALGNAWSGFVIEDQNVPGGFPSEDFSENADFQKTNDSTHGGRVLASGNAMDYLVETYDAGTPRHATDFKLVEDLTKQFIKKHGKKGITHRDILQFLQDNDRGDRQYLASDIARCLKHKHKIVIPDVLDVFPIAKTASSFTRSTMAAFTKHPKITRIYNKMIELEIENMHKPRAARMFRRCAANLAHVIANLEQIDG